MTDLRKRVANIEATVLASETPKPRLVLLENSDEPGSYEGSILGASAKFLRQARESDDDFAARVQREVGPSVDGVIVVNVVDGRRESDPPSDAGSDASNISH